MLGVALAALAALAWGAGAIFVRLGMINIRPTTGTLITLMASLLCLLPVVLLTQSKGLLALTTLPAATLLAMALSGVFNFGVGRLFNYNAVRLAGVAKAAPLLAISPLISVLLAVVFLGEHITVYLLLGTVTIVGGTILVISK